MCATLDYFETKGREEGREKGREEGVSLSAKVFNYMLKQQVDNVRVCAYN